MGKKKSFSSSGLAALTGKSRVEPLQKAAEVSTVKPVTPPIIKEVPTIETIPSKESSAPVPATKVSPKRRTTTKKKKSSGLQDPNKRSIKKSNAAVTLYLNAHNLEKLKTYAENEEQKISWLIDDMIYDFLQEHEQG